MDPAVKCLWIFGYGSLLWRPAFDFVERRAAFVSGFTRRFWQGSTDHRGVPRAPGRVVTLESAPEEVCCGIAYRIAGADAAATLAMLDQRERGGFERRSLEVVLADDGALPRAAIAYVAAPDNPNYLGPASLAEIARQVRDARGPSGSNLDYVLRLAGSLRALGAIDAHVFALEELLLSSHPLSKGR